MAPQHAAVIAHGAAVGPVLVPPLVGIAARQVLALRLVGRRPIGVAAGGHAAVGNGDHLRSCGQPRLLQVHAGLRPHDGRSRAPLGGQLGGHPLVVGVGAQHTAGARPGDQLVVVAIISAVIAIRVPARAVAVDQLHVPGQIVGDKLRRAAGAQGRVTRPLHVVRGAHIAIQVGAAMAIGAVQAVGPGVPAVLAGILVRRLAGNEGERAVEHLPPVGILHARGREARLVHQRVHIHQHRAVVHIGRADTGARGGIAAARQRVHVDAAGVVVPARVLVGIGVPVLAHTREVHRLGALRARPCLRRVTVHLGQPVYGRSHIEPQLDGVAHFHAHGAGVGQIHRRHLGAPVGHDGAGALAVVAGIHHPLDAEQGKARLSGRRDGVHIVEGLARGPAVGGVALRCHVVVHSTADIGVQLGSVGLGHPGHLHLHAVGARIQHVLAEHVLPADVLLQALGQIVGRDLLAVGRLQVIKRNALIEHRIVQLALYVHAGIRAATGVPQHVFVPELLAGNVAGLLGGVPRGGGRAGHLGLGLEHLILEANDGRATEHREVRGRMGVGLGLQRRGAPVGAEVAAGRGQQHSVGTRSAFLGEVQLGFLGVAMGVAHIHIVVRCRPRLGQLAVDAIALVARHAHQGHVVQGIGRRLAIGILRAVIAGHRHIVVGPAHGRDEAEFVRVRKVAFLGHLHMARIALVGLGRLGQGVQLVDGDPVGGQLVVVLDKDLGARAAIGVGLGVH